MRPKASRTRRKRELRLPLPEELAVLEVSGFVEPPLVPMNAADPGSCFRWPLAISTSAVRSRHSFLYGFTSRQKRDPRICTCDFEAPVHLPLVRVCFSEKTREVLGNQEIGQAQIKRSAKLSRWNCSAINMVTFQNRLLVVIFGFEQTEDTFVRT